LREIDTHDSGLAMFGGGTTTTQKAAEELPEAQAIARFRD
jgi:hypothetical protein